MSLESRARRAAQEFRRAVDDMQAADPERGSAERFTRFRERRHRNQRVAAGVLALGIVVAATALLVRAFSIGEPNEPASPATGGRILYGDWDAQIQRADWFTAGPDGTGSRTLGLSATCAAWFPDGRRILITNDAAVGSGAPLRPAIVDPDGSNLIPLDAVEDPNLNLGCGDVSPDGERIALEGFGQDGHSELDGIYSIRASDGGDLLRLVRGPVSPPRYSPDGRQLSYFDTKEGISPTGSGALFVMPSDASADPVRITPWGYAFDDHAWSPDGRWIVFQRPYGRLYLVHPDGSSLHRLPLELPSGAGALNPSWSPDGQWIVLSLQRAESAAIYMVRADGTGLQKMVDMPGVELQHPDWAPPAS